MWIIWLIAGVVLLFGFVVFWGAPYVPSKRRHLEDALDTLVKLDKDDLLVDIGSGDGVVLRQAAKRGAKAVGYELNPALVAISRFLSRNDPRVNTYLADFWKVTLPDETTVVYVFGESRDIAKMAKKVEQEATRLKRPLLFISYGFQLKDCKIEKRTDTHFLYRVEPLQPTKAQV
ncbi:MAG TPA: methyltransferase domain-containing protein [Candidatus Saccharimonadales bacterium]